MMYTIQLRKIGLINQRQYQLLETNSHIDFGIEEGVTFMRLLFLRCNAVGFIQLSNLSGFRLHHILRPKC